MVVSNGDVAAGCHPNTNGEVGDAFAANLAQVVALVVKHLDAHSVSAQGFSLRFFQFCFKTFQTFLLVSTYSAMMFEQVADFILQI